jgi:hypothetical protein
MPTYSVYRFYPSSTKVLILSELALEEAKEHCKDHESSSRTCSEETAATEPLPVWLEGYEED